MTKIFISVGDPSADKHAARLMRKIKDRDPNVEFVGLGGDDMFKEGLQSIVPISDIAVVGFWEVAKKYSFFKDLINRCSEILLSGQIDLFLPIDYPGFNLRLAKKAKEIGIPVVYYIAPQLWAWGSNRTEKLKGNVDKLLVVLPFEENYFNASGIDSEFVGHPLLEDDSFNQEVEKDQRLIAFLPGSRLQEIKKHEELFVETMRQLVSKRDLKFGIARPSHLNQDFYKRYLTVENTELWDDPRKLMKTASAGVVKTGTSNLEAALCNMPFSMVYKTSYLTYFLGKNMINLDYISLVNILADKEVVPELIQKDASPERISSVIFNILDNPTVSKNMLQDFQSIRKSLGTFNASQKASDIIFEHLK